MRLRADSREPALLTPGSYSSEICRAEQLHSLRKGKGVIPLLAAAGSDIPLHLEAKNHRDLTRKTTYAGSFRSLLEAIEARNGVALPPSYRTTSASEVIVDRSLAIAYGPRSQPVAPIDGRY
jgi:hypothetical protein